MLIVFTEQSILLWYKPPNCTSGLWELKMKMLESCTIDDKIKLWSPQIKAK